MQREQVTADAAYAAAEARALRTTSALIISEAQVLTLRGELERVTRERDELLERTADAGEVTHDAASEEGRPCAGCTADTP